MTAPDAPSTAQVLELAESLEHWLTCPPASNSDRYLVEQLHKQAITHLRQLAQAQADQQPPSTEAIAPAIREYCGDNSARHGEPMRVLMRGMGSSGLRVVVYETAALTLGMCDETLFDRITRPAAPTPSGREG